MKNKKQASITLGIMFFILTLGIVIQINTINNATSILGQVRTENNLKDEVLRWQEKYESTYQELEKSQKELENYRKNISTNDEKSKELEDELKKSNILLGTTDVNGPGIILKVEDGTDLIHQEDLMIIINELRNAGAEAISVNGQRVVSNSFISCDGNVILINGTKIGTPFTINAIGSNATLYGALKRNGGYLEKLENWGIKIDVKKSENVSIEKYNGVLNSKYIKVN